MNRDDVGDLQTAVENLHNCKAKFISKDWISEEFEGKQVWLGEVYTFEIIGHPKAAGCYAWSSPIEGSTKRKFYAVLKLPPVESSADAVRASIAQEYKKKE